MVPTVMEEMNRFTGLETLAVLRTCTTRALSPGASGSYVHFVMVFVGIDAKLGTWRFKYTYKLLF
jgi:hypothetical protein